MFIAKVTGNVWATRKHADLKAAKLLLVRSVEPFSGKFFGEPTLAVDGGVNAGPGDTVLVMDEGGSARKILQKDNAPVRTVVCGVVDQVQSGDRIKKYG